ncbi:hypothetical protein P7K49_032065 [Saguinus oedipus]|uniref:Uncharacterized protein n=1 Tax=Saguinus oedipus TaxID=9490 RepID=A0ABQ9TX97_SAGOE|nr:hypothetical protein P7K49_032065 [Saguinus oedipus]
MFSVAVLGDGYPHQTWPTPTLHHPICGGAWIKGRVEGRFAVGEMAGGSAPCYGASGGITFWRRCVDFCRRWKGHGLERMMLQGPLGGQSSTTNHLQVLKVTILAEKYAVEYTWYVDTILNLISIAGD